MSLLSISSAPHISSGVSTKRIMLDVLIALIPSIVASCILFSLRALLVLLVSVVFALASEVVFELVTKRKIAIMDLSSAVTGVLLALNLPYTMPLWQVALGSIVAVAFVKMLFGGLGQNFANPAITARIVLLISFTETGANTITRFMTDAVTTPTPLKTLVEGNTSSLRFFDLFLGNHGGAMGETCILALLIGTIYLLCRRVITLYTPVSFIGTVFLLTWIFTGDIQVAFYSILSGGLFLGAFFMATDYTTTPITKMGHVIFGVGCGVITTIIRLFCQLPEGVSYSILLMNLLTPFIDKVVRPHAFGGVKS